MSQKLIQFIILHMSKWRPILSNCVYVIGDIHGASDLLDIILKRILPLRRTDGVQDKIIFLGDYIDRHFDSHKVLDTLVALKNKYKDNVIFLTGNHELMMLEALEIVKFMSISFDMWMTNGGYHTLSGYVKRSGHDIDPLSLNISRIRDLIPKEHIDFLLKDLQPYHRMGNFLFTHAGCDPMVSIKDQSLEFLTWDRQLLNYVLKSINEDSPLPWDDIIVTGHNSNNKCEPIITDKYMMLDCGAPKKLLVVELNSMEAFIASYNKKRLVKFELKETVKRKSIFRRIS